MKRILLFSIILIMLAWSVKAQEPCGTKAPSEAWKQWFQTKIVERKADLASGKIQQTNYVIPVIVHIIYNDDDANLTSDQIYSQISILNEGFGGQNAVTASIPMCFRYAKARNTEIQFCPAKQKPDGTALLEEGIDRVN